MAGNQSLAGRRAAIDRRLDAAFEPVRGEDLSVARAAVDACPDRRYGQLVALAHDAASDDPAGEPLAAATAVELLRGYYRLRGELLGRLDGERARQPRADRVGRLLSGDYLFSAAYSALGTEDDVRPECFEAFTDGSRTLVEAFGTRGPSPPDHCAFLDETAGTLGECAAVVGATLAGVDGTLRAQFAAFGRAYGTARQVQQLLDGEADAVLSAVHETDDADLRAHGVEAAEAATRALDDLSDATDAGVLRAVVEPTATALRSP